MYSIRISLESENFKGKDYYFWCIVKTECGTTFNCGHGYAESVEEAFSEAKTYYSNYIEKKD